MDIAATMKVLDALRPKSEGETVNVHVVRYESIPTPDFEAMRKLIMGADEKHDNKQRIEPVPQNG
ncbi:MAG: hypothetical protein U1E28_18705 [Beijerinckiaceae bacterium]